MSDDDDLLGDVPEDSIFVDTVDVTRDDGAKFSAIQVIPKSEAAESCNGAGVLVVAGEWGLGDNERERVIMPLAEFGYFVLGFELVRDRVPDEDVRRRAARIDPARAIDDIAAALLTLKELARGKLGVIGLDAAGAIAVEAATVLPQIDAVVHAGGPPPHADAKLNRMRAALVIHRAQQDSPISVEAYASIKERISRAHVPLFAIHDYPAADGFFVRPRDDDEQHHAIVAWDRTRDHLNQLLT